MACTKSAFKDILELPSEKRPRGKIIIKAETVSDGNNEITIQAEAFLESIKGWCRDFDWPYLMIERARMPPE